jgi:uncharacterized protein (TIGR03663 family)
MRLDGSRLRADRTLQVVLALAVLALLARLVFLGTRVAHYDEARVAYWTYHYLESGQFHYRFIIHGPFIQHVDRLLFELIGISDFATRLPVAIVGGLLPLSALLFRHRLRDVEVMGVAVFLAGNAVLLYYSRFMRSTVLVAAFCSLAFALFLRAYDGYGTGYLHAGAVFLALGFAAKENAIIYVLCWLGAGALLVDAALFRRVDGETGADRARAWWARTRERTDRERLAVLGGHLLLAVLLFLVVVLFFYAPRNGVITPRHLAIERGHPQYEQVVETCRQAGLWRALPSGEVGSLVRCTGLTIESGLAHWFGGAGETTIGTYAERLGLFLQTSGTYAGPLMGLAVAGFLVERYVADRPRPLVLFAAYWGFASVVGYPLGTDVWGAWIIVNALVPLAIPAAAGLGLVVRAGRDAIADDDRVSVGAVAVLLLVLGGQMAVAGATGVYADPTGADNGLVQFAQPAQESRAVLEDVERVAATSAPPHVLVYDPGGEYLLKGGRIEGPKYPRCLGTAGWYRSLPLTWYYTVYDAEVECVREQSALPPGAEFPPVVVVEGGCAEERLLDCRSRTDRITAPAELGDRVPAEYERHAYFHRTTQRPLLVYVDPDAARGAGT